MRQYAKLFRKDRVILFVQLNIVIKSGGDFLSYETTNGERVLAR